MAREGLGWKEHAWQNLSFSAATLGAQHPCLLQLPLWPPKWGDAPSVSQQRCSHELSSISQTLAHQSELHNRCLEGTKQSNTGCYKDEGMSWTRTCTITSPQMWVRAWPSCPQGDPTLQGQRLSGVGLALPQPGPWFTPHHFALYNAVEYHVKRYHFKNITIAHLGTWVLSDMCCCPCLCCRRTTQCNVQCWHAKCSFSEVWRPLHICKRLLLPYLFLGISTALFVWFLLLFVCCVSSCVAWVVLSM